MWQCWTSLINMILCISLASWWISLRVLMGSNHDIQEGIPYLYIQVLTGHWKNCSPPTWEYPTYSLQVHMQTESGPTQNYKCTLNIVRFFMCICLFFVIYLFFKGKHFSKEYHVGQYKNTRPLLGSAHCSHM